MKPEHKQTISTDSDETVVRPISGDGDDQGTILLPHPDETLILEQQDPLFESIPATNPFCIRAASLLSLVPKLRMQASHDSVEVLYDKLVNEIKEFETIDPESGISKKQNQIACFFLCALLDESILKTPWGSQHHWQDHSLLRRFHDDGQEGRKFFVILKQLLQRPKQNIHLLELAYICMSLGYEGVYRHVAGGVDTIAQYRQKLFDFIEHLEGPENQILSTDWQGIKRPRRPMIHRIPLWIFAVGVGVMLMLIYFGVIYLINRHSDEVAGRIDRIARKEMALPSIPQMPAGSTASPSAGTDSDELPQTATTAPATAQPEFGLTVETLKEIFSKEIDEDKLIILQGPTLRITNAFRSGSDRVKEEFMPMLSRIAKLLSSHDSRILIVGHTDNQPIFSGRFPSNWHLSQARAKRIATHFAVSQTMVERIRFEGHGASEPITANDTEENRALNRRIDIHIR